MTELFKLLNITEYDIDVSNRGPYGYNIAYGEATISRNQFNRIKMVMQLVGKITMNADDVIYAYWGDYEIRMYGQDDGSFNLIIVL